MLGFYLDIQNVTGSKLRQPDVLISTGEIANPEAHCRQTACLDSLQKKNKNAQHLEIF